STTSVTKNCQVGYRNFNNRHLVVVDTPGFFDNHANANENDNDSDSDNNNNSANDNDNDSDNDNDNDSDSDNDNYNDNDKKTCIKIGQSLQTTVPGPHAFLIVLSLSAGGRVTKEVKRGYKWITMIFGDRVLNYCIIIFTGLDNLNEDGQTVTQYLAKRKQPLAKLMEKCGERYVAFNNRASLEEKNNKIQELLDLIDRVIQNNGNQVFTNKEIEAISKVVQEENEKGGFIPNLPDGSIILLPQTEKIVVEAYMRRPVLRRDMYMS
ncbi:unnamed protein product, partial [Rotaria sp. Silwood1]